jgi:DNA polymerase-3 subunit chi
MVPKILFTSLKTPSEKVRFLIKVVFDHYLKNHKIIIFTQDLKTAQFVDNLLWSEPKESFLPHFMSQSLTDEKIVITCEKSNLNEAKVAFNLTSQALNPIDLKLHTIFEIEDLSMIEKTAVFKKKLLTYQKSKLSIISLQ